MKTIRHIGRDAFTRALYGYVLIVSRAWKNAPRAFGAFALASTMLLASFGVAQAQPFNPGLLVSQSLANTVFGQPVTFTATVPENPVAGFTPTGTITLTENGQVLDSATVTDIGGNQAQISFTTATLAVGTHSITFAYSGDNNFTASMLIVTQTVSKANALTAVTTTTPTNTNTFGQPATFVITVTAISPGAGTPTGTVSVTAAGSPLTLTLSGGTASFTTSSLPVGNDPILATYNGDNNFNGGSNASFTETINQATPTVALISSQNPSAFGQSVTFTATVSAPAGSTAIPMGTVTFTIDGSSGAPVNLVNGLATTSTSTLTVAGSPHSISATFTPSDGNFTKSTSNTVSQTIVSGTTATALKSSANPSTLGQPVTFTATVTGTGGTSLPSGNVTFTDGSTTLGVGTLSNVGGIATATVTATLTATGTHAITATYPGDTNFTGSSATLQQVVNKGTTTTTLASSPNPSTPGQAVTFTATVAVASGTGTPTGTVTFKDSTTTLGTGTLTPGGTTTFTTSTLSTGSHNITAVYGGDTNFAGSTSAVLVQNVNATSDSTRLRELQISATPIIANLWGQAVSGAMDDAVSAGFGGNPQALSPAGTGFTYYFTDDPPPRAADPDADSLRRYLTSPTSSLASPNGNSTSTDAKSAAANDSVKRVDDDFRALGYAGGMPTKAPPATIASSAPRDWLAWINVRGSDYWRGTVGNDLKGNQVDAFAGLTRRISPNFVVGVLGGYEHFDYSSQAFNGVLKGDGWTVGAYLGWKLAPNLRFDAGGAWSDLLANGVSGIASGHFLGTRWLVNGGLTGTYPWQSLVFEPSARVFALWEHENAYTDSLGTFQPARNFETGRASTGVKAIYPLAWTSSVVALSPYAGIYADYYFSKDDAQTAGLTTVPLLQGFSARATGGVAASFAGGATLGAGGEFGGIGSATHIWTWTARGRIPF